MSTVKLVVDGARMEELLRSPTGPVGRHLIARSTVVQAAAKDKAGRVTGCLADSIVKRVEENPATGFLIRIVADTQSCSPTRESYALWVEEGSAPHDITAKNASALAFDWPAGPMGGMFFAARVHHPGIRAKHFLKDSLPLAVA